MASGIDKMRINFGCSGLIAFIIFCWMLNFLWAKGIVVRCVHEISTAWHRGTTEVYNENSHNK